MLTCFRVVLDLSQPLDGQLAVAIRAIRDGLVVAFPTDTLYGLAVDPRSERGTSASDPAEGA